MKHLFTRTHWNHPDVVGFFKIPELKQPSMRNFQRISTPVLEEFTTLMGKAERLFHSLKDDRAFHEDLEVVLKQLSELVSEKRFKGDQRRFYDLKREVELYRLKNANLTEEVKNSFSIGSHEQESQVSLEPTPKTIVLASPEDQVRHQKIQLRFQDAILQDLESTVLEQKHLSIALAEEIEVQTQFLSDLQSKQDGTVEQFEKSSTRVQKLK